MNLDLSAILSSFITLLVIMDPFGGLPVFMALTREYAPERAKRSAFRAIRVSFILLLVFVLVGENVLAFFGISLFSFQVGGGLILLIIGLLYVLNISQRDDVNYDQDIVIPMATPLIAGPGAITAVILLVAQHGMVIPTIAISLNLFLYWIAMYNARHISKAIGEQGLEIMSRIMGLLLVALAIEMIRSAWMELL